MSNWSQMLGVLRVYPKAVRWVRETVQSHEKLAVPLESLHLPRLAGWVPDSLLATARAVPVDRMPRPPLERWNLHGVDDFAFINASGLTLDRLIFVRPHCMQDQSLLFHELVHVIQWRMLRQRRFLAMYGLWLLRCGYDKHPLEIMAYELQARFDAMQPPVDLVPVVERRTQELAAKFKRQSLGIRMLLLAAALMP